MVGNFRHRLVRSICYITHMYVQHQPLRCGTSRTNSCCRQETIGISFVQDLQMLRICWWSVVLHLLHWITQSTLHSLNGISQDVFVYCLDDCWFFYLLYFFGFVCIFGVSRIFGFFSFCCIGRRLSPWQILAGKKWKQNKVILWSRLISSQLISMPFKSITFLGS